jgi:hypothetical protein
VSSTYTTVSTLPSSASRRGALQAIMIAEQQPVAESSDSDIEGPINFLARLPLYATVKPYAFRHKPNNGCPATNMENETHRVMIRNMRSGKPSYEQCGFTFCRMSSKMTYEQYNDFKLIESVHFPEIEAVLKEVLGFKYARIVNWGVCPSYLREVFAY